MSIDDPIVQVRLFCGDSWTDIQFLEDDVYSFLLEKHVGSVRQAGLEAARYILFKLSRLTRERAGDIERYGDGQFKNYRDALAELLRNPNMGLFDAMPYAGGISKSDMESNNVNPDVVSKPFWRVWTEDSQ